MMPPLGTSLVGFIGLFFSTNQKLRLFFQYLRICFQKRHISINTFLADTSQKRILAFNIARGGHEYL